MCDFRCTASRLLPANLQSRHYGAYVFEDKAAAILEENPVLRQELELKKRQDEDFNKNASAQLEWVYTHSSHYEKEHNRLPVFKTL